MPSNEEIPLEQVQPGDTLRVHPGEKAPPPLATNVVIAVGNCGPYAGPWGVRVGDTVVVKPGGSQILTYYVRQLEM
jgi:Xaa-Pro aminopeptidase